MTIEELAAVPGQSVGSKDAAVMWCLNRGLRFDAVNDNLPENKENCDPMLHLYPTNEAAEAASRERVQYATGDVCKAQWPDVSDLVLPHTTPDTEHGQAEEPESPPSHRTEHWAIRWPESHPCTEQRNSNTQPSDESAKRESLRAYRIACLESLISERRQCKRCYIRLRRRAILRHPLQLCQTIFWRLQRTWRRKHT